MTIVVRIPDDIWDHYHQKYDNRFMFNYFLKRTIQRLNIYINDQTDIYFILPKYLNNRDFHYLSFMAYSQFGFYINNPTEVSIHLSNLFLKTIL